MPTYLKQMMLGVIQNNLEGGVGNIIIETRLSMSEELLVAGWQVVGGDVIPQTILSLA